MRDKRSTDAWATEIHVQPLDCSGIYPSPQEIQELDTKVQSSEPPPSFSQAIQSAYIVISKIYPRSIMYGLVVCVMISSMVYLGTYMDHSNTLKTYYYSILGIINVISMYCSICICFLDAFGTTITKMLLPSILISMILHGTVVVIHNLTMISFLIPVYYSIPIVFFFFLPNMIHRHVQNTCQKDQCSKEANRMKRVALSWIHIALIFGISYGVFSNIIWPSFQNSDRFVVFLFRGLILPIYFGSSITIQYMIVYKSNVDSMKSLQTLPLVSSSLFVFLRQLTFVSSSSLSEFISITTLDATVRIILRMSYAWRRRFAYYLLIRASLLRKKVFKLNPRYETPEEVLRQNQSHKKYQQKIPLIDELRMIQIYGDTTVGLISSFLVFPMQYISGYCPGLFSFQIIPSHTLMIVYISIQITFFFLTDCVALSLERRFFGFHQTPEVTGTIVTKSNILVIFTFTGLFSLSAFTVALK